VSALPAHRDNEHASSGNGVCLATLRVADPLNWGKAAEDLTGSHLEAVKRMVEEYTRLLVKIEGTSLTVAQVAAVAAAGEARVELDDESARGRIKASSDWVMNTMMNGTDSYGVTTGFGATSHRRTKEGGAAGPPPSVPPSARSSAAADMLPWLARWARAAKADTAAEQEKKRRGSAALFCFHGRSKRKRRGDLLLYSAVEQEKKRRWSAGRKVECGPDEARWVGRCGGASAEKHREVNRTR
jgi:hypothetical protein